MATGFNVTKEVTNTAASTIDIVANSLAFQQELISSTKQLVVDILKPTLEVLKKQETEIKTLTRALTLLDKPVLYLTDHVIHLRKVYDLRISKLEDICKTCSNL